VIVLLLVAFFAGLCGFGLWLGFQVVGWTTPTAAFVAGWVGTLLAAMILVGVGAGREVEK